MDIDGKILKANANFCEIFELGMKDMLEHNFFHLLQPVHLQDLHHHIQQMLDKKINFYQVERDCFSRNGEALWVTLTVSIVRDEEKPPYFILQLHNLSMHKQAEERLKYTSYHDALTSLPNRNKFEQDLNHFVAISQRHGQSFGIIYLDLDRFENINEGRGRDSGDALLQIIANRISKTVRNTDLVARYAQDQFAIIIASVKKPEAVAYIAEKILANVSQPMIINSKEIFITGSIGISLFPHDGNTADQLMQHAQDALSRAKERGRDNYQFYSDELTTSTHKRLALQSALQNALIRNEFNLNYQPVMELATRKIIGVEALIRWKNPDYGMITPAEIITLTEESGLIIPVSEWVLSTACKSLFHMHNLGYKNMSLSINCSDRQFKQTTFVDEIINIIKLSGVPPQFLELEITEALIMDDPEKTIRVLYALKDLGVRIVVDDFGSGYWSWMNLRRLNIDKIKIDKMFIKKMLEDSEVAKLTAGLIAMINKLGIISIAEGVENRAQYEFLLKEGCQQIQGYYLSQPLAQEALLDFLQHPIPAGEMTEHRDITV